MKVKSKFLQWPVTPYITWTPAPFWPNFLLLSISLRAIALAFKLAHILQFSVQKSSYKIVLPWPPIALPLFLYMYSCIYLYFLSFSLLLSFPFHSLLPYLFIFMVLLSSTWHILFVHGLLTALWHIKGAQSVFVQFLNPSQRLLLQLDKTVPNLQLSHHLHTSNALCLPYFLFSTKVFYLALLEWAFPG